MSEVVIGVDVGSSGTCAQAIDTSGALLASVYRSYDVSYVQPGWADQDPEAWMKAVVETVAEARAAVRGRPVAAIAVIIQLINEFRTYDLVYVLTKGGPGIATDLLSYFAYKRAFLGLAINEGAAVSFVLLVLVLALTVVFFRIVTRRS